VGRRARKCAWKGRRRGPYHRAAGMHRPVQFERAGETATSRTKMRLPNIQAPPILLPISKRFRFRITTIIRPHDDRRYTVIKKIAVCRMRTRTVAKPMSRFGFTVSSEVLRSRRTRCEITPRCPRPALKIGPRTCRGEIMLAAETTRLDHGQQLHSAQPER
jgi:hypothetical protein